MEKQRKIKMLSIIALVIAVLGVTIAFAVLSGTLRINGSGTMDRADWNIYFDNLSSASTKGKGSVIGTPILEEHGAEISNIKVKLKQPQDSVTYTVDIVNNGDIDAEIDNITLPTIPNEYKDILDFKVVYTDNNEEPKKGDVLTHTSPNNTRNLTIKISYKDITNENLLPDEPVTMQNLSYSITYVQSNRTTTTADSQINGGQASEAQSNNSTCTASVEKDTYSKGDIIALCNSTINKSEDFYVLSDNGTTVTALAKYNLLLGNAAEIDLNTGQPTSITPISNSDPEYGIQSSKTSPVITSQGATLTGTLAFSSSIYWAENGNLKQQYGSSYPAFVFDGNSNLWTSVQDYKDYLRDDLGKTSVTATILSYEQAIANGCSEQQHSCSGFLADMLSWTGTAASDNGFVIYFTNPSAFATTDNSVNFMFGLRPVITINKSEL